MSLPHRRMPSPTSKSSKADHGRRKPLTSGKPLLRPNAPCPLSSTSSRAEPGTPRPVKSIPPLDIQTGADPSPDGLKRTAEEAAVKAWSPKRTRAVSSLGDLDEDENCGSGNDGGRSGRPCWNEAETGTRAFACPFYRRSPLRHMDCLNRKLTRIRDVKQHIKRRHALAALYCPTCYVSFSLQSQRDDHIRSRSCESRTPSADCGLEGVSDDVQRQLKHRVGRMQSRDEQWYTVWDIVFVNEKRPPKPRLGTVVDEILGMIRDLWWHEGPQIVPEFLESNPPGPGRPDEDLERLLMGLFDAVHVRFEQRVRDSTHVKALDTTSSNRQSPLLVDDCPLPLQAATAALPRPENACSGPGHDLHDFDFSHTTAASPPYPWNTSSCSMTPAFEGWDPAWAEQSGNGDIIDGTVALPSPLTCNDHYLAGIAAHDIFQDLNEFSLEYPPFIGNGVLEVPNK